MKFPKFPLLTTLAVALLVSFSASPLFAAKTTKTPVVSATDAKALKSCIGKKVCVEGTVVNTSKGPKDGMRFINFSDGKKPGFNAALVPAVYAKFPKLGSMVGKKVRVTGNLESYQKRPVIKVSKANQVKVMKAPKAAKAKKAQSSTTATKSKTTTAKPAVKAKASPTPAPSPAPKKKSS